MSDFDKKDYSTGNYVIRHPNGSEFNYSHENDDKEVKSEEEIIGMMGFSLIVAGMFFGLYVIFLSSCFVAIIAGVSFA